ncbi:hypothetical protein LPTSP4_14010 [Leptospira ryugenii]|uniref:PilZ domain-containing protein n=1 Tax=Leptospira ryugenii TaxID=1917863 RepID=A0A2P2DZ18_9LEPT|nr:PilZ domain-containing protein [Leptospira ryugenii]GBF49881.1 hypothetical protein LPTSP4_14010 [Leptospira ryugenii]
MESRKKERITAAWDDFVVKIYSVNGSPEYLLASFDNISEMGVRATLEMGVDVKEKDLVTGIIESELTKCKIKYSGKVVWLKTTEQGIQFGVKFDEELLLPDVFIARSMAAA